MGPSEAPFNVAGEATKVGYGKAVYYTLEFRICNACARHNTDRSKQFVVGALAFALWPVITVFVLSQDQIVRHILRYISDPVGALLLGCIGYWAIFGLLLKWFNHRILRPECSCTTRPVHMESRRVLLFMHAGYAELFRKLNESLASSGS
jgi:hypothetical protein